MSQSEFIGGEHREIGPGIGPPRMLKFKKREMRSPSEFIVDKSTARLRREFHFLFLVLWFVPGTILWIILADALWFVGFMSLYAIWITHLTGWAAETPVEDENDEK